MELIVTNINNKTELNLGNDSYDGANVYDTR